MNQRVTARIVGGKRFTTAEYREYFNASRILRDQANRLGTSRRSFIAAGYELKIHPRATPLLSALTGASPRCTAQDHIELPYRQLLGRCEAHAEALQSMASQLNELSSLIAQTQSLYAQAEEASRKGLNIMLRGLFMSSRESAILALTASALMGVRRSYAKEGKFNKFYLVESTAWMQESFVSVLGEHASRLNIQERPSKDTSILEYITKTLFMVTKPGAVIAEGLSGKGSVNRGLKKIDRLLIPYFDKDHGDNLSVTRVYPKTKVVRGGTSTKDAIADQRQLSEGPLNGERESGLEGRGTTGPRSTQPRQSPPWSERETRSPLRSLVRDRSKPTQSRRRRNRGHRRQRMEAMERQNNGGNARDRRRARRMRIATLRQPMTWPPSLPPPEHPAILIEREMRRLLRSSD